ncbi:glycosyltransferase family 2 protein [Candidatus Gottesmanbacteria bacterium]|nr:glycosyltransferase family 2 protein [Candidatus Gottesmanbacteria bacterium]
MKKLSVAIATFNEEAHIGRSLASVSGWADEIVLVDGGSRDNTVLIAKTFGAKIIETTNPPIFHINKQKALDACSGIWILQLDADEVVTHELRNEIIKMIDGNPKENGYYISRRNYFLGHWLHKGGQYPDYVMRLFKRGKGWFPAKNIHEQIVVEGPVGYLKEPLEHYSYRTMKDYWRKADAYTSLTADELARVAEKKNIASYIQYEIVMPVKTFLSIFLRHKGFLDGIYGFLFALFSALHYPIAYQKYRVRQK